MRLAAIFVPLFPLAARLRSEPELTPEAVVIVEGNGSRAHVIAATKRARKVGIRPGLSLPQARAILPKLIARGRDEDCERAAHEALYEVAERFSPRIEPSDEGVVFLEIDGLERHFASERELASSIIRTAESVGLPVRVGIASSKLAARVAAELPKSPNVVARGEEESFLAPLPLARLSPEMRLASLLRRWGIDSIGEFASLPEGEIATRLGEIGRELHYAARGIDARPLVPRQIPPIFEEGMELEWPIVSMEPFLFIANAALDRLCTRLGTQGYSCRRLEITLRLEPEGFDERSIEMPSPTREAKTLLALVRLDLETRTPGAAIGGFRFIAHPDRPRRAQLSLFGPPALSPDKLSTTIARIASIVGPERVGTAVVVDAHAPEAVALAPFDPPPPPTVRPKRRRGRGLFAVRCIRPPMPVEVIVDENDGGLELRAMKSITSGDTKPPIEIAGRVRIASGPWNLEEGWWTDAPITRDYWDVELISGGIYRAFCEEGAWFVDGLYD